MSKFGTILHDLRLKQERTQTDLAKALGIARSTVSMYEQGAREPDLNMLEKIADYLHVDINILLGRKTEGSAPAYTAADFESMKMLLEQSKNILTTEQKQELMRILLS